MQRSSRNEDNLLTHMLQMLIIGELILFEEVENFAAGIFISVFDFHMHLSQLSQEEMYFSEPLKRDDSYSFECHFAHFFCKTCLKIENPLHPG